MPTKSTWGCVSKFIPGSVNFIGISLDYLTDRLTGDRHSGIDAGSAPRANVRQRSLTTPAVAASTAVAYTLLNTETDRPRGRNTGCVNSCGTEYMTAGKVKYAVTNDSRS